MQSRRPNQLITRAIERLINQSTNHSINQSENQSMNISINQSLIDGRNGRNCNGENELINEQDIFKGNPLPSSTGQYYKRKRKSRAILFPLILQVWMVKLSVSRSVRLYS